MKTLMLLLGMFGAAYIPQASSMAVAGHLPQATPTPIAHTHPRIKVWTCASWEQSSLGGSFKRCEYR